MAIFGGMNRKPAFGQIPGMGMMQPEMQQPQYGAMAQGQGMQAPPAKQPGFFSKGGGWIDALGAFGDAFGDNGPVYAQGKQREQDLMRQEQMAEQQRMQRREDMQWEWQNKPKDTRVNDTEQDWNYYKGVLTPAEFETWKQNKINPPRWIGDEYGGGQFARPGNTAPAPALDISNGLPSGFKVKGGAASNGGNGFR